MSKRGGYSLNSKSQTTIFIIIGIILVGIIGLFFLLKGEEIIDIGKAKETNPNIFLQSCIEDKVREGVELISKQGGYIENPLNKTFRFTGEKDYTDISYLCYTVNYYLSCVNQEPMLIQHLKDEVEKYISDEVEDCFDELVYSLEKEKYVVDANYNGFDVELAPKKVIVNINAGLDLTKSDESLSLENFKVVISSRFYELAVVVQEIISQEARFCHFEHLGFMALYHDYDIDRFRTSDLITIYTIKHRQSEEMFRFAVRACVIPPGF